MIQPRIIPVLLLKNKGTYKTVNFKSPRYLGDPINMIKIFNEKLVDEIIILDIDATVNNTFIDDNYIKNLASQAQMPACYGGGINTLEKAKKVISAGFEKIAISSRALVDLAFLKELVRQFGAQSVVVVLDLKLSKGKYSIYTHNGKVLMKKDFLEVFDEISKYAGEVVINSIDNDGKMAGYDLFLASLIESRALTPITFLGGASSLQDLKIITDFNNFAAAASSLFVFQGNLKAILPSYLNLKQRADFFIGDR